MSKATPDVKNPSSAKLYGIFLGYPFDQLLSQRCPYLVKSRKQIPNRRPISAADKAEGIGQPGIVLPDEDEHETGSGNIVITGPPGSAKSTLAIQFAVACTHKHNNQAFPAYVSLENSPEEILEKAREFGWGDVCRVVHSMQTEREELTDALHRVLTQPACEDCPIQSGKNDKYEYCQTHAGNLETPLGQLEGRVLLASLSPRPLAGREISENVFWERYQQLERLLVAAATLREVAKKKEPTLDFRRILPVVVLDSLNMLAMRQLGRNEIATLFQLFRQHQTVGIFVVESTLDTPFDSTLADVVISLDMPDDDRYFVRRLKVVKSRYRQQVYGWHPLRMLRLQNKHATTPPILSRGDPAKPEVARPRCGVVPYPSLHYVILRSGEYLVPEKEDNRWTKPDETTGETWGVSALSYVLPSGLRNGSVFVVEGPRGTRQMNLAMTFLAKGLAKNQSVLLIRLHDSPLLQDQLDRSNWPVLSKEIEEECVREDHPGFWNQLQPVEMDGRPKGAAVPVKPNEQREGHKAWQNLIDPKKAIVTVWKMKGAEAYLFEVDFKSGALLPEELVQAVWDIIIRRPEGEITRAVLDDVSEIGAGLSVPPQEQHVGRDISAGPGTHDAEQPDQPRGDRHHGRSARRGRDGGPHSCRCRQRLVLPPP